MSNPAPAKKGIDSVLKLLEASGDLSVIIYKAQKAARKADGSLDVSLLGQAIAGQLMTNPAVIESVKNAASSIGDVTGEIKDLDFTESLTIIGKAGGIAAKCAQEINS